MNRLIGKLFLLSIAIFWTTSIFGAEALTLQRNHWSALNTPSIFIPPNTPPSGIYEIIQDDKNHQVINGYSGKVLGFRLKVTNPTTHRDWVLVAKAAGIFNLNLYKVVQTDHGLEFVKQITDQQRVAVAHLDLAPNETAEFFGTYRTYETTLIGFAVVEQQMFVDEHLSELSSLGVAAGIMLAVIIYNGFLLISLRQKYHFYYILFAVSNSAIAMCSVNFPPSFWEWFYQSTSMDWTVYFRCLGPITTFAFTATFLGTRAKYPKIHRLFISYLVGLGLIVTYYTFISKPMEMNSILDPYFLLAILLMLGAGVHAYRSGFNPAKYYLLAITAFFIGIIITLVYPFFVPHPTGFFSTSIIWGQAAEMLLMSLALASEIKTISEEKFRAIISAETKSRLLRVISHDIRNPLAIIKGYSNILSERMPDEINIQKILRSANVIQEITELAQRSEAERKTGTKELVPVSIRSVFDELAFLFHRNALDKNIHLNFVVYPDDLRVIADETILTNEVLGNLIGNAIKFSFSGSAVEVKAFAYGEKIRISVKDRGIGIPKNILPKVFDKEANVSRRGTSGELGSGFGLPIAYSFVHEFKGRIEVTSTSFEENDEKRGTEFIITLRRASSLSLVKDEDDAKLPD